ncbi:hypothetical protein [Archangium primigenium]|uniref:hypothetical protein n=1 Tax=[Archangium] primigenium TaxID=2792470 RepID=UPI00195C800D|nr:hypothetical protein [Archangium primigenium]MBM7118479.1 hypothetical protein [Archangium primigenium]
MRHWLVFVWSWLAFIRCCPGGERMEGLYAVEGLIHYSIPGMGSGAFPVPDTFRIAPGKGADFELADETGRCRLYARAEDAALVLERGASCGWNENGVHFLLTVAQGRVEWREGSGHFDMAGHVTATARGTLSPGQFLQRATLTRLGD